jgi:ribokinase
MIVCFGSVNLDLIFRLPALPVPGQTVLGRSMVSEPGGKGANQAVAAARDGAKVVFAGAVGRDGFAEAAVAEMQAAGIDLSRLARTEESTGAAAICVDPDGRNLIAVASGANLLARAAQVEDALLAEGTTLLLQNETDPGELAALILRARRLGARIVLNLAPAGPVEAAALRAVDVLVVNEDEAEAVAAACGAAPGAAGLHAALGVDVVVTLGGAGVEAASSAGRWRLPAHPVTVVDTTGAGDCFTGVLAAALDRCMGLAEALARGNVAAGLCCTRKGTQRSLPWRAEIDAGEAPS